MGGGLKLDARHSETEAQNSGLIAHGSQPQLAAIQVLPPEVVERIAAGEVIERPVSVVRELMDNALDAGARELRIDVRGGGLRSIRVGDDGSGIPADQADLALRHHATSKIRCAEDLSEVTSLGFRGEALPSIAAVSELSLSTLCRGAAMGVRLELRYGDLAERSYLSRPPGTTVTVRNLFANVPVRLKFVGGARAESALISQLVRRYALAHPQVRFHLSFDGHPSLHTSGLGLEHTVGEVFGAAISHALLPLGPVEVGDAELSGLITGRHVTRSSRQHLTLLVNERAVHSRSLLAALEEGYRPLLPRGRHPIGLLSLRLPRSHLDVNVHPSKAEVKMRGEALIAAAMKDAVRELLGRSLQGPAADQSFALGPVQFELPRLIADGGAEYEVATGRLLRELQVVGQVRGSLIVAEHQSGMYVIDQHRAHERSIYELLRRQHAEGRAGQLLLEPLHLALTSQQVARLEPRLPELAALGFACEWFGGRSFLVRSVPVIPETADLPGVIEDLLDLATDDESDWQHRLLTSVACHAALKRGRQLSVPQARELLDQLAATATPAACPHGSPIILQFSERFLEHQFGW